MQGIARFIPENLEGNSLPLVLSRECGNEPEISLKGNQKQLEGLSRRSISHSLPIARQQGSLPPTNMAPAGGYLEDPFPLGVRCHVGGRQVKPRLGVGFPTFPAHRGKFWPGHGVKSRSSEWLALAGLNPAVPWLNFEPRGHGGVRVLQQCHFPHRGPGGVARRGGAARGGRGPLFFFFPLSNLGSMGHGNQKRGRGSLKRNVFVCLFVCLFVFFLFVCFLFVCLFVCLFACLLACWLVGWLVGWFAFCLFVCVCVFFEDMLLGVGSQESQSEPFSHVPKCDGFWFHVHLKVAPLL